MLDTNLRKGELKMKDKIFGVLQRVGRSFMLPIALLPVAGLLLGIGSSFTNETMLAAYGLNSVIHPGITKPAGNFTRTRKMRNICFRTGRTCRRA